MGLMNFRTALFAIFTDLALTTGRWTVFCASFAVAVWSACTFAAALAQSDQPTLLKPKVDVFAEDIAEPSVAKSIDTVDDEFDLAPVQSISNRRTLSQNTSVESINNTPANTPALESSTPSGNEGSLRQDNIASGALIAVAPDSVGILSEHNGGFRDSLWEGLSFDYLQSLIRALPDGGMDSATWNLALRRLMLTQASVPSSVDVKAKSAETPVESILADRVHWLLHAGYVSDALKLATLKPARLYDPALSRDIIVAQMISGQIAEACAEVRLEQAKSDHPILMTALVFCRLISKDTAGAMLTMELMEEIHNQIDPLLIDLVEAAAGVITLDVAVVTDEPLLILIASVLDIAIADRAVEQMSPLSLQALVSTGAGSPLAILRAVEFLAARGVIEPEALAIAYATAEIDQNLPVETQPSSETQQFTGATATLSKVDNGPKFADKSVSNMTTLDRAVLYRRISTSDQPSVIDIVTLWSGIETPGLAAQLMRATTIPILRIVPAADNLASMPDIVRALVISNRIDAAARWDDQARQMSAQRIEGAAPAVRASWAWLMLAGQPKVVNADDIDIWRQTLPTDAVPEKRRQLELTLLTMLADMGHTVPPTAWSKLVSSEVLVSGKMPDYAAWHALTEAARQKRVGEALLLSALLGGQNISKETPHLVVSRQIRVLGLAGLLDDARALAREIAMATGL